MAEYKCKKCGGTREITCEVCNGTGRDNDAEGCWKCNDTGKVECEYCKGTGIGYVRCPNCGGKGEVSLGIYEKSQTCPSCGGDGCARCNYTGTLTTDVVKTSRCSRCGGSGTIQDPGGEKCWKCNGTGKMECSYCNGRGVEACHHCDGQGKLPCPDCEKRDRLAKQFKEWIKWDYYGVVLLLVAIIVALVPFVFGAANLMEYLTILLRPSIVIGVVAFIFAGYVYCFIAELEFHNVFSGGTYFNKPVLYTLLTLISLSAVIQGLYADVPQITQFLLPAKEWIGGMTNMEWSYIAGVCALKVGIIAAARKWGWNFGKWNWEFGVEKGLIVLLAAVSLAFVIWPTHLPEGMALKGAMEQALPFVALPVRFIGLAVYWPLCIALWLLGFVGRMAVALVMWIVSLFM